MIDHRPRLLSAVLAAAVLLSVLSIGPAHADSVNDAKHEAQRIAAQIADLQPRVDQALADYDTALQSLGESISLGVAARRTYEALQARADAARAAQASRVVALYESGGPISLYGTVLETGDPSNLNQLHFITGVVAEDAAAAASSARVADAAKQRYSEATRTTSQSLTNADLVDQRLQAVQDLLDQQQALFDEASAKAQHLEALRRAATELAAERAAAAAAGSRAASSASPEAIPPAFRALYLSAAATCPGLSWTVLAAIGQVETHHGRGTMVSSAGALGPMQFLPGTFARYAVDGDHDGKADIMDPADAIFSAAHYLCANGAGAGGQQLYSAIWHYNHADWYVRLVVALASKMS